MAITTSMIKELRDATGLGIADCKDALQASDGDVKMQGYADDITLHTHVLPSPFAVFAVKYNSTTKVRSAMRDVLKHHIVK